MDNKRLLKTKGVLQIILDNPLVGIILTTQRRIIHANKKMADMLGYDTPDELIGKSTRIIYHSEDDYIGIGQSIYSTLNNGKEARYEMLAKRKDGSEFWCLLSGKSVNPDEADNADSVWIFQDIDEFKRQKDALESNIYRAILNNSLVGILLLQRRHIVSANKKMAELFGYDGPEEMVGNITRILYRSQADFEEIGRIVYSDLAAGKEAKLELIGKRKDGSEFWCLLTGKSVNPDETGGADSVWIYQDITREKEVDMMKTDFISTVSHELRTPLTSILGFANIISKKFKDVIYPVLNPEDKKTRKTADQIESNLDIIISEGNRLTSLINDVLDIAKMEAGKVEWKDERFTAIYAIEHAVSATSSLFQAKGLGIITEVEDGISDIYADKDRFIQVIINLLSNAVKFTDKGNVTVRAKSAGDFLLISVSDNGIGISKENLNKVFEKFKQVGDTLTDKPKGTGLGLPICKQIVGHYGGKIWTESKEGKGSTFYFTAPRYNEKAGLVHVKDFIEQLKNSEPPVLIYDGVSKNILIVDDDDAIRKLLKQELEYAGYTAEEAIDGIKALEKIKSKKYDLIILDVMMPGLSGFDVARVLKNNPDTMNIPVMILSVVEDKDTGFKIGVDKYLVKGSEYSHLLNEVDGLLGKEAQS
ncbi:MAG: ATP-binding protein [Deltaproteobacteria bacterium]|nr:ATP-binding protein [Deltaproteobacteria bacterium]